MAGAIEATVAASTQVSDAEAQFEDAGEASVTEICPVCQDTLVPTDEIQVLPCGHKLHTACLDSYSSSKNAHWVDLPCAMCKVIPSAFLSEDCEVAELGVEDLERALGDSPAPETQPIVVSENEPARESMAWLRAPAFPDGELAEFLLHE